MCDKCGRPFGKRRRCYFCNGKKRSGEQRICVECGKSFYVPKWHADDQRHETGKYCSRPCHYKGMRLTGPGARNRRVDGYIQVYYPSHPMATRAGWILEHRLVAAEAAGRLLTVDEHVDHINEIKDDNRPENLRIVSNREHQGITMQSRTAKARRERAELAEYRRRYGPLTDWSYEGK